MHDLSARDISRARPILRRVNLMLCALLAGLLLGRIAPADGQIALPAPTTCPSPAAAPPDHAPRARQGALTRARPQGQSRRATAIAAAGSGA